MAQLHLIPLSVLLACLVMFSRPSSSGNSYVETACSVTHYRNLCIHTLSPFSNTAKRNPTTWARAGVSVTIREAKRMAYYLETLKKSNNTANWRRGRNRIALSDCMECFQDTLDNLHKSLGVLRKLSLREFSSQLDDVTTWVSAALTDEDTCLDGFGEQNDKRVKSLLNRVYNISYLTSNALALINKLATAGPKCLNHD